MKHTTPQNLLLHRWRLGASAVYSWHTPEARVYNSKLHIYKKILTQYYTPWPSFYMQYQVTSDQYFNYIHDKIVFDLWCFMPLSTIFQLTYIFGVSFIGGGNRITWRKPPTCHKSLTNFLTYCMKYTLPWTEFEFTPLVVVGTDCTGNCKSNYHRSRPWRPLHDKNKFNTQTINHARNKELSGKTWYKVLQYFNKGFLLHHLYSLISSLTRKP